MTREEAIADIKNNIKPVVGGKSLDMAIEALSERNIARDIATILENEQDMRVILQNADRPKGEWKHTITWQPYCSNCEYVFGEDEEFSPFWKFCPMCGAEMADNSLVNDITESPNDVIESQNDVIEIVRCKDCKWHKLTDNNETEVCTNKQWDISMAVYPIISADDFCSYGERREP